MHTSLALWQWLLQRWYQDSFWNVCVWDGHAVPTVMLEARIAKIYPLDAMFDVPEDVPDDIKSNKRDTLMVETDASHVAKSKLLRSRAKKLLSQRCIASHCSQVQIQGYAGVEGYTIEECVEAVKKDFGKVHIAFSWLMWLMWFCWLRNSRNIPQIAMKAGCIWQLDFVFKIDCWGGYFGAFLGKWPWSHQTSAWN